MTEQNPKEVSLSASVTDSSLSVAARSRTIAALDHLFGAFIGIPIAWLERIQERIRNKGNIEDLIQEAVTDKLKTAILDDKEISPLITELAIHFHLGPIINKFRVTKLALEHLSVDDPIEEPQEEGTEVEYIDKDWLNHFGSYAEKASSEEVRHLWARVLAGEIRETGSFSLSSLRLLSELDFRMARTFEREVRCRIDNSWIVKPNREEMKDNRLLDLTFLEEVGLLQSIDPVGGVIWTFSPDSNGEATLREKNLLLVMEIPTEVKLSIILLTRAGREIAQIMDPADPLPVLEKVGQAIEDNVKSMQIRKILASTQEGFHTVLLKVLKEKQV